MSLQGRNKECLDTLEVVACKKKQDQMNQNGFFFFNKIKTNICQRLSDLTEEIHFHQVMICHNSS